MRGLLATAALSLAVALAAPAQAATVYKWVDANATLHLSSDKTPGRREVRANYRGVVPVPAGRAVIGPQRVVREGDECFTGTGGRTLVGARQPQEP